VPWIKGHQGRLTDLPMPGVEERLEIAWDSRERLRDAGFIPIGMDHFAKPGDELAIAATQGGLRRNFQGYCTSTRAGQVYALGASAISQLEDGYVQNAKDLDRYLSMVNGGCLSHENAYRMRPEDKAVRNIINGILCDGESNVVACLNAQDLAMDWKSAYLNACSAKVSPLILDDLAEYDGSVIRLTGNGGFASRAVAACFDPMLKSPTVADQPRYSKAL